MNSNKATKYVFIVLSGVSVFFVTSKWLKSVANYELDGVEVILTAKVLKDDVFQLSYWEKTEEKFKTENSVRTKIKGSERFQEIAFDLPAITDLYRLRLDIGESRDQEKITIQKIEFNSDSGDNEFGIGKFNQLFAPNKFVEIDGEGRYSGISGTSGKRSFYDPYFISIDGSKEIDLIRGDRTVLYPYLAAIVTSLILMLYLVKNQEKIALSTKGFFVCVFILILVLPTLQKEIGFVKELESLEKRKLSDKPDFSFSKKFTKDFEAYLDDNFGFRNRLVDFGAGLKTKTFRSSVHPEKVMLGKNKWLYFNHFKSNIFDSYRNENLLPNDTLRLLIDQWERNKKIFSDQGRKYFLAFWPNKHSIYPEFLPSSMAIQIKDTISRVDQIISYINEKKSNIHLVDVRPKLIENKKGFQLYHKFDTHWNDYGAFLGYQSFFEQIQEDLEIVPKRRDDFIVNWTSYTKGDLIQMLGVRNRGFFEEQRPKFILKENKSQIEYLPIDGYPKRTIRTRNKFAGNELKVLVFRDSYSNSLIQFFSLHFYEVIYIRGHKEGYVKKENPDVIIDCFVEREIGEKHTINKL